MLYRAVAAGEPAADLVGIVVERTHAAAIGDVAGFVNDVEAFGPSGVGVIGGVIDVVDAESDWVVEAFNEIVRDSYALSQSFRLGITDVVLHVGLHLPLVSRMSFAHIYGEKVGVILIIIVNLHHVTYVAAKRRSSVAAKYDDQRASASAFANVKVISTIESEEPSIRSVVTYFERAAVHVGQGIAQHAVGVLGAAGHLTEKQEHGQQKHQENANRPFPEETHR
jgi:hypothetical protein